MKITPPTFIFSIQHYAFFVNRRLVSFDDNSKLPHPFYIPHDCPQSNAASESVVQELTDGTLEIFTITAYIYGKL